MAALLREKLKQAHQWRREIVAREGPVTVGDERVIMLVGWLEDASSTIERLRFDVARRRFK